jgi:hypothetical protein
VIYALEFFWMTEDGSREQIARQWQPAPSQEVIEARARAVIRNVLLGGRRANLCIIRDTRGERLSLVVGGARGGGDKAPRRPSNADAPVIPSA